jgi:aryl-alcohol dehydrogenase-like predicted oxidoreductase
MKTRRLGTNGPEVSALGLGCMGFSGTYGPAEDTESLKTIHAAIDAGITLLDTGDFYGMGHNELLVGRAIKDRRDKVFVAVKFGALRAPNGQFVGYDARPAAVKTFLAYSLQRLGTDYIDLYQPARLDPAVPIEDTIGAIGEMLKAGYVRHIGVSELSAASIKRAQAAHPIAALQIEYSLMSRGIEREILPAVRELGMAVTAYGVLSRGLLGGYAGLEGGGDIRHRMPRFAAENLKHNQAMVDALGTIAAEKNANAAQIAIAWVLARGADIIPLIGTRKTARIKEAIAATQIALSADDLRRIEAAVPASAVAGGRYDATQMHSLDSEK